MTLQKLMGLELGSLVRENVGFDTIGCRIRLVLYSTIKRIDNIVSKCACAGVRKQFRGAVHRRIHRTQSQHIHLDLSLNEGHHRMHVQSDSRSRAAQWQPFRFATTL
jgi:hypothetical protein